MFFFSLKIPAEKNINWDVNDPFKGGFWPRCLKLVSQNFASLLHLGGSLVTTREGKMSVSWKQIISPSHALSLVACYSVL